MKNLILIAAISFLATACGGKMVIQPDPCDPITNRDDQQVCGKDTVMKACRKVVDKPGVNVCEKL